jgi:8-oxo-dGTP pyrophosphatase MutT (NUDIX family)
MKKATLVYCVRGDEVLLGMKKIRFGAGKWNGFGGKVDAGETTREAAARELFEESGIAAQEDSLQQVALVKFFFEELPIFECHAFITRVWEGDAQESDEMAPQWFSVDMLPFDQMWDSDTYWVPQALRGERVQATFIFDEKGKKVREYKPELVTF